MVKNAGVRSRILQFMRLETKLRYSCIIDALKLLEAPEGGGPAKVPSGRITLWGGDTNILRIQPKTRCIVSPLTQAS